MAGRIVARYSVTAKLVEWLGMRMAAKLMEWQGVTAKLVEWQGVP
jgi:hypothetical protein